MPRRKRKSISKQTRLIVWDRTKGRCWYCGKQMRWGSTSINDGPHIDHMNPVCQGGEDDLENLVYACTRCNSLKSGRTIDEFRTYAKDEALRYLKLAVTQYGHAPNLALCIDYEMIGLMMRRVREAYAGMPVVFWGEMQEMDWNHYSI